ncbi:MAG: type II toxin-antitoxin system prevent-host-death family antitoxin [Patulibacter sp.]
MKAIGVRELRQQASRYLRDVERGETIEVTDRGRPVARLVPVPASGGVADLITSGRISPPTVDLATIGPPSASTADGSTASDALRSLREHER